MEVNINQFVSFVLTERGAKILTDDNDRLRGFSGYRPKKFEAGQMHKMQLWKFASTFGPYMTLGNEAPCKDANITIEPL